MSASDAQAWVAVLGALITAAVAILGFFNYRTKRDYFATVGQAFSSAVDGLSDVSPTKQIAAAILLRRFFDPHTELGRKGRPYQPEAVNVIAGTLREEQSSRLQKTLADGLRYARKLPGADLQHCNLANAYLGKKTGDDWVLDLSHADMFGANLDGASLKKVRATGAVFYDASLQGTVFEGAELQGADFRGSNLSGAKFPGAVIEGAKFQGAENVPVEVTALLDDKQVGAVGARVPPRQEQG